MTTRTDYEIVLDAIQTSRRILGEYIEPGRPRDAEATINRLLGLLDNQNVEAALKRIDLRHTFELVSVVDA